MRPRCFKEETQVLRHMTNVVSTKLDVANPQSLREGGKVIQGMAVAREQLERDGHRKARIAASGREGLVEGLMCRGLMGMLTRYRTND